MRRLTDDELIRRTLGGDQGAFAELVRRYQRRVAVTVRSVVGEVSRDDLADTVQDIFLLVFRGLGAFRGDAQFGTWLTRSALRHCYREAKRQRRRRLLFSPFAREGADEREPAEQKVPGALVTDRALIAGETNREIGDAMARLPEEFRTVLVLRIVEEMPVEEVAAALGVSTGTVKSRLFRAKEKMRELLSGSELTFEIDHEEHRQAPS
jgi:RNA polymerase sigma-70 factor (ECF subfamily)